MAEKTPLICSHCGKLVGRLLASRWTVKLPTGKIVHQGDLICEECQRDLANGFTLEERTLHPPE